MATVDPNDPYMEPETDIGFGAIIFAASMMVLIGAFQALAGLVAIIDDDYYVVSRNYTFDLDTTAWGWIHLIIGVIVFLGGVALFGRRPWAGYLAIGLAMISAIANFFFIPYYPFWALLIIALDVFVIWGLSRPGVLVK
jgi:hypothetical protein